MSVTGLQFLFRVDRPYLCVGVGEPERKKWAPSTFYSLSGVDVCVRRLRGDKMRTTQALMNEIGAALQFFEGFGENWYALEECLSYLDEWLPSDSYVLVVEQAELLLVDEPEYLEAFFTTVNAAGEFWSAAIDDGDRFDRSAIPFHVLLNISDDGNPDVAIARLRAAASDAGVLWRTE